MKVPEPASRFSWSGAASILSLVLPVVLFLVLVVNPFNSLLVALAAGGAALVLLLIAFVQRRFRAAAGSLLIAAVAAVLFVRFAGESPVETERARPADAADSSEAPEDPAAERGHSYIKTTFYSLHATEYRGKIRRSSVWGGGFAKFGGRYLLVTGNGRLVFIARNAQTGSLSFRQLPSWAPMNAEEFREETADNVTTKWFRVGGVAAQERGDKVRLFVSHHFWKSAEKCVVARVSEAEGDTRTFGDNAMSVKWRTVFETTPCLPMKSLGNPFAGHQLGGRLALVGPQELLFAVGDQEFDGFNGEPDMVQDRKTSYGKTILIHLDRGSSEMYTLGHRNPQGLYVDPAGAIWETEHGPNGGDELNLVQRGANYGWPLAIYGSDYDALVWPLSRRQGDHAGFTDPIFAWVPSIAVSAIIGVEKNLFPVWKGDLLMATLRTQSLWRMRIRHGRVEFVEPILIGRRLRDLIEMEDGRLLLWTDDYSVIDVDHATDTDNGGLAFETRCYACHAGHEGPSIGPALNGIVGRRVASVNGFEYSKPLEALGGVWSESRLDEFLANPRRVAPGTTMQVEGIKDAGVRKSIIVHLRSLK